MRRRILADLLETDGPDGYLIEVISIIEPVAPRLDPSLIVHGCRILEALYGGGLPGYRACNTGYHDFSHAIGTFLTMARLVHGAIFESEKITEREILIALIAAGFHDSGYIQKTEDQEGTGAKFRMGHEQRSIGFLTQHASGLGLSPSETESAGCLIRCTDMSTSLEDARFTTERMELLGRMLSVADLLAQLSEQVYLEKLLFLYKEDMESKERRYSNKMDTFRKALEFYQYFKRHLDRTLPQHDHFLKRHFKTRWNISDNLYLNAISMQHCYLSSVLNSLDEPVLKHLRRRETLKHLSGLEVVGLNP